MAYNPNWPRWVIASVQSWFDKNRGEIDLYYEGQEKNTEEKAQWAELRIDGPFAREESKDCWFLDIEVNVVITCNIDQNDLHKLDRAIGKVASLFTQSICVNRFGDGDSDDQSWLGELHLMVSPKNSLGINRFGKPDPNASITQATVDAHYRMNINLQ